MALQPTQKVLDSPEYKALTQLQEAQQVNDNKILDAFCKRVEHKYTATSNGSDVEELLQQAWKAVVALASRSPYDGPLHKQLVGTIMDLQKRPNLEKAGQVCVVQDMTVWRDLPMFGWQMREAWNQGMSCSPNLI